MKGDVLYGSKIDKSFLVAYLYLVKSRFCGPFAIILNGVHLQWFRKLRVMCITIVGLSDHRKLFNYVLL